MKYSQLFLFKYSRGLLIMLMAAHLFGTIFAYTIYINLSSLGDGYNPDTFVGFNEDNISSFSTMIVHAVYAYMGVFFPGFMAPMSLGLVIAFLTWRAFRDVYIYINPKIFWICNLLPHYLVWSGSSSKEQIVIICGILIIDFVAKNSFTNRKITVINFITVILSLLFMYIIRPNYFIIYFTIFLLSLFNGFLKKIVIIRFTNGLYVLIFILMLIGISFTLSLNEKFMTEDIIYYMQYVEASFLSYEAGSNRTNIQWNDISDFLLNSLWGIPQGFIGPTFFEVIAKPIQIPAFAEGIIYLCIFGYLFTKLLKITKYSKILKLQILVYLFVAIIIIFISYPFLIFNVGSALRYKQSLHPILIFYPLLILAYTRVNNLQKTSSNKIHKTHLSLHVEKMRFQ